MLRLLKGVLFKVSKPGPSVRGLEQKLLFSGYFIPHNTAKELCPPLSVRSPRLSAASLPSQVLQKPLCPGQLPALQPCPTGSGGLGFPLRFCTFPSCPALLSISILLFKTHPQYHPFLKIPLRPSNLNTAFLHTFSPHGTCEHLNISKYSLNVKIFDNSKFILLKIDHVADIDSLSQGRYRHWSSTEGQGY